MEKINFGTNIPFEKETELIKSLKKDERVIEFLNENNLDISIVDTFPNKFNNWLDDLNVCNRCNGLKYCKQPNKGKYFNLIYDGVFSKELVMCDYLINDYKKRKHLGNYYINDLSDSMSFVEFDKINFEDEDTRYLNNVSRVFDCLEAKDYGLFIYGSIGSGKTYIAACACNKLAKEGYKVSFVNLPLFSQRIKTMLENNEYQKEINKLINSDFLVIDDIGAESVTSWFRDEILFTILNERMENKRWTWFTSNEDFNSLKKHFEINNRNIQETIKAERIMARIKTLSKPLEMLGKDRRNI